MLVQLNYLKNRKPIDVGPLLSTLCQEIGVSNVDPSHLLVSLDWLQYKKNFREPVAPRRYLLPDGSVNCERELAIDVRRLGGDGLDPVIRGALAYLYSGEAADPGRLFLEDFCRPSQSIAWEFNRAFWQHLSAWEDTFRRDFQAALPGGVSDGTNPALWHDCIEKFLRVLDDLHLHGLVPEEIYILELGVGSGHQARVWLDTFREMCADRGRDYYGRVRYLMTDYSPAVLRSARQLIGEHGDKVSCLHVDAADPLHSLAFLRYKVLYIHSCNLYDNLPTDEVIRRNGHLYEVRVRAYLPATAVDTICATHNITPNALPLTISRFLRIGPEYFDDPTAGVHFWADVWDAIRLEECCVQLEDLASLRLGPGAHGVRLDDVIESFLGDIRMHLSTVALQSFANTLPLLHPRGIFQVQDLFVTDLEQYRGAFRGPGKMDGSIVNWLNGPLFRAVGEQFGYAVHFAPFVYRERSNTVVLTTSQKE